MTQLHRRRWLCLMCGLLALSCSSCSGGDTDRLSVIWHKVGARLFALTQGVRQRLSRGWASVQSQSVTDTDLRDRVTSRLRLEKTLAESAIEVEVNGTTVILRGQAPDMAGRRRAVELAQGTLEVEQVTDELEPKE